MSTVIQRIPHLLSGISQQPDSKKFPGQVRDALNAFPDYALGMLKRPGGEYVDTLVNATPEGRWFSILRDNQEKYIGQYDDNVFRIWSLIDGSPRVVNMGAAAPGTCSVADSLTALNTYRTARNTVATRLQELNNAQANHAEVLAGQNPTEEGLFEVTYDYSGPKIEQSVRSGILRNSSNVYVVKVNGTVISSAATLPSGYRLGTEMTNEQPIIAASGYKVYQVIRTVAATHDATDLSNAVTAMSTAQTNYDNAVAAETNALNAYNAEVVDCAITALPANAYLDGAQPEDIEVLTLNDFTYVLNKAREVAMTTNTTAALPHEAQVVISVVAVSTNYTVVLDGTSYTFNSGTNPNADTIAQGLRTAINGTSGFTAEVVGPGLYISRGSAFTIETRGATQEGGLYAFQHDIATVSSLPSQARNGYRVRVVNTSEIDIDDMWVEFQTSSGATYGVGTWIETVGPGLTFEFDANTLPHQLVRQADGTFEFGPINWDNRVIGDDNTNPIPSFVGTTIRHMFLYRNRLGFLCNEGVVLGKAGDLFNFWNSTALTATDDDPIDISASTAKPVTLNYVRPTSVGLVLFGDTEQFLLSTDSDILSPKTAKINTMSSYECDPDVEAVSAGVTTAFISKTALYTKLFEVVDIRSDAPPLTDEPTNNVPELIPSTINSFISSPALSILSMGTTGNNTVYQYRYYQQGDKRQAATWYRWQLTGNLLDQFFDQSTYYVVVANGTEVSVQAINLRQSSDTGFLTLPTGERTDVCLDLWTVNPYRTYNDVGDSTRVFLPYGAIPGSTFAVMALGGLIGDAGGVNEQSVGAVLYPTVQEAGGETFVDIDGDYRGRDLVVGYIYNMEIELPKFYITNQGTGSISTDLDASLILHRINVSTGLSGPVTYEIDLTGIPTWQNTVTVTQPNDYVLNNVNMKASAVHTVPIYQRNNSTSIKIVGNTPFPVNILSLTWEGKYNTRFYKRLS